MFSGPGGVGKLATALALAKALHCSGDVGGLCDCQSCRAIRAGTHPDVLVLSRDRLIGVEEMREIVALALLKSGSGRDRLTILDRAENITPAAANCALKTLEEPGDHVRFILITDTPSALLSTVRSRAYNVRFTLLASQEMEGFARNIGDTPSSEASKEALRFAGGRPGLYLRWMHLEGYGERVRQVSAWSSALMDSDGTPTIEKALEWKREFWDLAEGLSTLERKADLPRGGDSFEIGRHLASSRDYPLSPVNWRADDSSARESRWGQGRKALLLSRLIRDIMAVEKTVRRNRAIDQIHDFMEKIRFNCSFDIALERLYFRLAGI